MKKSQSTNWAFFGEYTNARMIIDLGERHEKKGVTAAKSVSAQAGVQDRVCAC